VNNGIGYRLIERKFNSVKIVTLRLPFDLVQDSAEYFTKKADIRRKHLINPEIEFTRHKPARQWIVCGGGTDPRCGLGYRHYSLLGETVISRDTVYNARILPRPLR
jgi:hypothetical protein